MNHFSLSRAVIGSFFVIAAVAPWSAQAGLNDYKICPKLSPEVSVLRGVQVPEVCYSGFTCTVGMRGNWLDITNRVLFKPVELSAPPKLEAEPSIAERGAKIRANNACVPVSNKDREGYVAVLVEEIKGSGAASIRAERNAPPGQPWFDVVPLEVRDGSHFLNPVQPRTLNARVGVVTTIEITGRGLRDLIVRSKPPGPRPAVGAIDRMTKNIRKPATSEQMLALANPTVSIVSQSYDKAMLKVNFERAGTVSLGDYLQFSVGVPAINQDLGWPEVQVGQ